MVSGSLPEVFLPAFCGWYSPTGFTEPCEAAVTKMAAANLSSSAPPHWGALPAEVVRAQRKHTYCIYVMTHTHTHALVQRERERECLIYLCSQSGKAGAYTPNYAKTRLYPLPFPPQLLAFSLSLTLCVYTYIRTYMGRRKKQDWAKFICIS